MRAEDRKTAIRAYKERKRSMGAYAVKCSASGQAWVGQSRNLDTEQNPIWFSLKLGSNRNPTLQQAWALHGPDAFTFERLEQLTEDETAYPETRLKQLRASWCERLGAQPI
jgi:hypothetical protein